MFNFDEFYKTFHKPYELSAEIDNTFAKINNEQGIKAAIEYLLSVGAQYLDTDNYKITYIINEYTKESTPTNKNELLDLLSNMKDYITNVSVIYDKKNKREKLKIITAKGDITIIEFSSLNPEIKKAIPFIVTGERNGKCFELAYEINRRLGISHKVVTGYIYGYTDKSRYLHSWIELSYKAEEYVIDGTLNAMINKSGYYLLKHAQPITILPDNIIQEDLDNNLDKLKGIPLEIYFLYRDEIINGIEFNNQKLELKPKFE